MSGPSIINQEPASLNYPKLKNMNLYTAVSKIDILHLEKGSKKARRAFREELECR
jgi:hypothetical protein